MPWHEFHTQLVKDENKAFQSTGISTKSINGKAEFAQAEDQANK